MPTHIVEIAEILLNSGRMLATAENCTGGMIGAACIDLARRSQGFERGFVTYSNEAKHEMLGVPTDLIATHGAVSEPVARAMAMGAIEHSRADVAVAVTGIAGPTGGSADKPVGTVWFGFALNGECVTETKVFGGDRAAVRHATLRHAMTRLFQLLQD